MILTQVITADLNLITSTCQQTPNPKLCVSTYILDPESLKADLSGLAIIGSKIIDKQAATTRANIVGLLAIAIARDDKPLAFALRCSRDNYVYITNYFAPQLVKAVTGGLPKFAEDALRSILSATNATPECFRNVSSPIYDENNFMYDFSLVLKAIVVDALISQIDSFALQRIVNGIGLAMGGLVGIFPKPKHVPQISNILRSDLIQSADFYVQNSNPHH
ncbi:hypothetical protein ACFE04_016892 [Oxalis oulophora]